MRSLGVPSDFLVSPRFFLRCAVVGCGQREFCMSLRAIARMYADGEISTTEVLDELSRRVRIPLSEGQRGLWALYRMEPEGYAYNVPICFSCNDVDAGALAAAFRDTLSRHPLLAATVQEADDGPFQIGRASCRERV